MSDIDNVYILFRVCAMVGRSIRLEYDNGKRENHGKPEQQQAGYKVEISGHYAAYVDGNQVLYQTLGVAAAAGLRMLSELEDGKHD